jgi:hypothetical protein
VKVGQQHRQHNAIVKKGDLDSVPEAVGFRKLKINFVPFHSRWHTNFIDKDISIFVHIVMVGIVVD